MTGVQTCALPICFPVTIHCRYISKSVSNKSVVGWTIFSASVVPIFMVIYGSLLALSDAKLKEQIAIDPIGALTTVLPSWYLIPFVIVAVLGLVILTLGKIDFSKIVNQNNVSVSGFIGVVIFTFAGIGLGWVNCAADYSRYISKSVSNKSVVGWTVFSASIVPIFMVIYGSLLALSDAKLKEQIAIDPIGALTTVLPSWYLTRVS